MAATEDELSANAPLGAEAEADDKGAAASPEVRPPLKPPLDPRVLRNVIDHYEGDTVRVPQCDEPVFHGQGTAVFRTGFIYRGAFCYGRMHGHGRVEWANGVVYEGNLEDNEMQGQGTYTWSNGSSYSGDVKRGQRHGRGVFRTGTRGAITQGEEGATQGGPPSLALRLYVDEDSNEPVVEATSDARYEGEWKDGLPHGRGVLVFDDDQNVRYEGEFVGGKRHGRGEMRYASGNVFSGSWVDDVKSGNGTMLWIAEGQCVEKYAGSWSNDRPHGFGRHVWLGVPSLTATARQREKNWYEGEFVCGVRHGKGTFYYANGARYVGEWQSNAKHGRGAFFYEDGRVFVGEFRDDRAVVEDRTDGGSGGKIILYVDDLLPASDGRERNRKFIEHAVMRVNTDLRALYRQYMAAGTGPSVPSPSKQSASPSRSEVDSGDGSGSLLLEFYECRRLLAECGVRVSGGRLEQLLRRIRDAQREASGAGDEVVADVLMTDAVTLAAELPEVVPPERLLLFREFAELLVRSAHEASKEVGGESTQTLADAFTTFYEKMVRAKQERPTPPLLQHELYSKELHAVFIKHHLALQRLFIASQRRQIPSDEVDNASPNDCASVRALLSLLQKLRVIGTPDFRVHHALSALQNVFAIDANDADAFFVDSDLLFTDFLDAIAVILFTKQQHQHQLLDSEENQPPQSLLFALVDDFLHDVAPLDALLLL